jgi:hypothetical protein
MGIVFFEEVFLVLLGMIKMLQEMLLQEFLNMDLVE